MPLRRSRSARAVPLPGSDIPRRAAAALAALAGALLVVGARPALGQAATPAPAASVTPYAGYLLAGSFLDGPVGTSLSSAGGPLYGAQLSIPLGRSLSVVGNVGYSSGDLRVGLPLVGGFSVGDVRTLLFDAGLELRAGAPVGRSALLTPLLQLGAGAMRRDVDAGLLQTRATGVALNAGVGADLAFGRNVALRVLAKDYVGKFDFKEATGFDLESKTAHSWALTAGLSLAF